MSRTFSTRQARAIGDAIGVNWKKIRIDEFRRGLSVELEHGKHDPETNISDDDLLITGKIAWAHLKEQPDYYTCLACIEKSKRNPTKEYGMRTYRGNPISTGQKVAIAAAGAAVLLVVGSLVYASTASASTTSGSAGATGSTGSTGGTGGTGGTGMGRLPNAPGPVGSSAT